jgi:hypothetical protein
MKPKRKSKPKSKPSAGQQMAAQMRIPVTITNSAGTPITFMPPKPKRRKKMK